MTPDRDERDTPKGLALGEWQDRLAALGNGPSHRELEDVGAWLTRRLRDLARTSGPGSLRAERADPWSRHEIDAWHYGERIGAFLRCAKSIRGRNPLLDACVAAIHEASLGRGRQNFVGALGLFGRRDYESDLLECVADPQLYGHAVAALRRAGAAGHDGHVLAHFSGHGPLWVRLVLTEYLIFCEQVARGRGR